MDCENVNVDEIKHLVTDIASNEISKLADQLINTVFERISSELYSREAGQDRIFPYKCTGKEFVCSTSPKGYSCSGNKHSCNDFTCVGQQFKHTYATVRHVKVDLQSE